MVDHAYLDTCRSQIHASGGDLDELYAGRGLLYSAMRMITTEEAKSIWDSTYSRDALGKGIFASRVPTPPGGQHQVDVRIGCCP